MSSVRHVGTEEPCSDKDEDPPTVARGRVTTAKPTPMARDCDSAAPFLELPWFSEACQKGFLANRKECPRRLTCFYHSHWVDLASFSSGDRPAVKRHCFRSRRPLPLKQSPHITTLLSDRSNWQAPPSPPSLPLSPLFLRCLSNNNHQQHPRLPPPKSARWLGESMAGHGKQCVFSRTTNPVPVGVLTLSFL